MATLEPQAYLEVVLRRTPGELSDFFGNSQLIMLDDAKSSTLVVGEGSPNFFSTTLGDYIKQFLEGSSWALYQMPNTPDGNSSRLHHPDSGLLILMHNGSFVPPGRLEHADVSYNRWYDIRHASPESLKPAESLVAMKLIPFPANANETLKRVVDDYNAQRVPIASLFR